MKVSEKTPAEIALLLHYTVDCIDENTLACRLMTRAAELCDELQEYQDEEEEDDDLCARCDGFECDCCEDGSQFSGDTTDENADAVSAEDEAAAIIPDEIKPTHNTLLDYSPVL